MRAVRSLVRRFRSFGLYLSLALARSLAHVTRVVHAFPRLLHALSHHYDALLSLPSPQRELEYHDPPHDRMLAIPPSPTTTPLPTGSSLSSMSLLSGAVILP